MESATYLVILFPPIKTWTLCTSHQTTRPSCFILSFQHTHTHTHTHIRTCTDTHHSLVFRWLWLLWKPPQILSPFSAEKKMDFFMLALPLALAHHVHQPTIKLAISDANCIMFSVRLFVWFLFPHDPSFVFMYLRNASSALLASLPGSNHNH